MAERSYEHNAGFISLIDLPDDKFIVGAVVVMMDDEGNYSSIWVPESMDAVPSLETQEVVGGYAATAFEMANLGVTS